MPKHSNITRLWVIMTLAIIIITVPGTFIIAEIAGIEETVAKNTEDPLEDFLFLISDSLSGLGGISVVVLIPVFFILIPLLIYLSLRLVMTILVCKDKKKSIKLNILKSKAIPVCECKEALKVWQIVLIYLVPMILMYVPLCYLQVKSGNDGYFIFMICILAFYWALDLTLLLYVLRIKIKDKIDYISVDYHVYEMTLYSRTYVRANKKARKKIIPADNL